MDDKKSEYLTLGKIQASVTLTEREQENLTVVHKLITALSKGNLQEIGTYLTDDAEFKGCVPEEIPFGGTFQGKEGGIEYFRRLRDTYEMQWEEHDCTVSQGDFILIFGRERTRVMPSGKILEAEFAASFAFRDGKIFKFCALTDSAALVKAYRGE
ncbi:MAG TPA: hypothetical protein EYP60_09515 [bacterium (Candidatus Stahlbacteria)]|nr:hypothetical protein [Candidatus Stahlbacteria bacterium]